MASYKEIQSQIEKLQRQADQVRTKEIENVVAQIRQMMVDYHLRPEDLGFSSKRRGVRKTQRPAKFQDNKGNTWAGLGKKPNWVKELEAAGKNLDNYLVKQ